MTLDELIGFDEFLGKTDAECVAMIGATVVTRDHSLWNFQRVFDSYSSVIAEAIFQRLKSDGMEAAALTYKDPGLDLSCEEYQIPLGSWSSDPLIGAVATELKNRSVTSVSRWQSLGFPVAPTEADIAEARIVRNDRIETQRFDQEVWGFLMRSRATKAQLKSAVAEW